MADRLYIFDTTLRDGTQTQGVDFSVADKQDIAEALDALGVDYVEGGWPGANPTDDKFFDIPPKLTHAKLTAFGMTRRPDTGADNDPGLNALLNADTASVCIVGKTWDFHVKTALGTTLEENFNMVADSVEYAVGKDREVSFDAEHFFDAYKANPKYALSIVKAAYDNGARWVVLCDTNGGTLPHKLEKIVKQVMKVIPGDHLGIHAHNDTGNAVANTLTAVRAGVRHVQGTLNGLGERCGNANLITLLPNFMLKMGFDCGIPEERLKQLTKLSRMLDEKLNRHPDAYAPYVGASAFAHKGGLHVSAVAKDPSTYEHIDPALVGNHRQVVISNQAGRSNVLSRLEEADIKVDPKDERLTELVKEIKARERKGYSYDVAHASFEILAHRILRDVPQYFRMQHFRVTDEREWDDAGELAMVSHAEITIAAKKKEYSAKASGNGPVNALDKAIHKALNKVYPAISNVKLVDYRVRIINPERGTGAVTRVTIDSIDGEGNRWTTVGISANVIDASYNALRDALTYKLLQE